MKTLTLEQVREAGLFSWRLGSAEWGRAIYIPGHGIIEVYSLVADDIEDYPENGCEVIPDERYDKAHGWSPDRWHHLPGCDCEWCKG